MERTAGFLFAGIVGGIASGLFGIGGGIVLIPIFGLLLGFDQHRAQGTSLVALIPPTGLLAVLAYAKAGYVHWLTGALLIPGLFLGGILGAKIARRIEPRRMRQAFAALLFLLGAWQVFGNWNHG
ncbi:MAG TPA: sulfite exporter TauE/SafE family protein [Candidatus Acidoferrum sp.]|nr:sulfite exporter TauE/SafE family protein [Candidatus Acidoferrum sp.]